MSKPSGNGFSLIELLVVISIISVVISIALPSLKAAKESAKRIGCADNLRQINLALNYYASDNNGFIVPAVDIMSAHGEKEARQAWYVALVPYAGYPQLTDVLRSDYPEIWLCPNDKDPYPTGYRGYPHIKAITSYAINGYYSDSRNQLVQFGPGGNFKFAQIQNASKCMLMAETSYSGLIYDSMHPNALQAGLPLDSHHRMTSGFYHSGKMNLLFVDGHIEIFTGIDCSRNDEFVPQSQRTNQYMFWAEKRLSTALETPQFWGFGYE